MFSIRLTISSFIFSNAFVWSSFHERSDFLFKRGLIGLPRDARIGTNLMYWFVNRKNDLNSFKFFGNGISLIALVLSIKVAIPNFDNLNPSHYFLFEGICVSRVDKILKTVFLWPVKLPLEATKMSSR